MKKSDVEFHSERWGRPELPAINVKCYNFAKGLDVDKEFNCSEDQAEKAFNFAWEAACAQFWEDAQEIVTDIFGPKVKCYSQGRSGGWLVVHGLPEFEQWNAVNLAKWSSLCKRIKGLLDWLTSAEQTREGIESNQWYKEGSEQYNFIDKLGETVCIADLKQQAIQAGFGAIIR